MFDRQTEEARCRLKRYRANVNRINNLLKMPVRINGPSKNVTVKIDDNPGGFIPKSHPDAMSDLQRIVEIIYSIPEMLIILLLSATFKNRRWNSSRIPVMVRCRIW